MSIKSASCIKIRPSTAVCRNERRSSCASVFRRSDFCFAVSTFRHRRVSHLSWPVRTGQVHQHRGRLWMRVLWRLWEWFHDDEKLHGWVQSWTSQLLHVHIHIQWCVPSVRHLKGFYTVKTPNVSVPCYSNGLLYLCNESKVQKDVSIHQKWFTAASCRNETR